MPIDNKLVYTIFIMSLALSLTSCSGSAQRDALCVRAAGLEDEFKIIDLMMGNLGRATAEQLTSSFQVADTSLTTLSELGPPELRTQFLVLLNTYDSLSANLVAVEWNGALAATDNDVAITRERLSSNEFVRAHEDILAYVKNKCAVDLQPGLNRLNAPNSTLPNPIAATDSAPDPTASFDSDESVDLAYGNYIAQEYDLEITNEQASCIGKILTSKALVESQYLDDVYLQFISDTLKECGIDADISG